MKETRVACECMSRCSIVPQFFLLQNGRLEVKHTRFKIMAIIYYASYQNPCLVYHLLTITIANPNISSSTTLL